MGKFSKKLRKALHKYTPAGWTRDALNHVRHKVGLDSKHIKGKLFGGSAGVGTYDSGTNWSPRTLAQLTTRR